MVNTAKYTFPRVLGTAWGRHSRTEPGVVGAGDPQAGCGCQSKQQAPLNPPGASSVDPAGAGPAAAKLLETKAPAWPEPPRPPLPPSGASRVPREPAGATDLLSLLLPLLQWHVNSHTVVEQGKAVQPNSAEKPRGASPGACGRPPRIRELACLEQGSPASIGLVNAQWDSPGGRLLSDTGSETPRFPTVESQRLMATEVSM